MDQRTAKQDPRYRYPPSPDGIHPLGRDMPTWRPSGGLKGTSIANALKIRAAQLEAGVIGYCYACGIQIYSDRLPCRESMPCCLDDCPVTSARAA